MVTIVIGLVCVLFCGLIALSSSLVEQQNPGAPQGLAMALAMYGVMAVVFIWLGIGSILCRRWARALLLVLSWGWLVMGVIAIGVVGFFLPASLAQAGPQGQTALPESAKIVVMATAIGFMSVIMIVIPAIYVVFYSRRNVRLTCEHRDPVERWTDRCPLPVLALSLLFGIGAPMMLVTPLLYRPVMPVFGFFLTGWPAGLIFAVFALLWLWLAWALYKLNRVGWIVAIVAMVLFAASTIWTYATRDIFEMYQAMGYSPAQLEQMRQFMISGKPMMIVSVVTMAPWLGYMIFLGKYFRRPKAT